MSSFGEIPLKEIWAMLDLCAPGHTRKEEDGDGTVVSDHVRYAVPFGTLANRLLVRRDLRAIFRYREERLRDILSRVP